MRQHHHLKTFIFKKLWQQWWGEFFLNGVHNSKQSRAPCTKGTKNLKIQRIRSHMGRGPQFFQNGDLILSEMGTKRGFRQQKKWDQKMRIFDKLTERR